MANGPTDRRSISFDRLQPLASPYLLQAGTVSPHMFAGRSASIPNARAAFKEVILRMSWSA